MDAALRRFLRHCSIVSLALPCALGIIIDRGSLLRDEPSLSPGGAAAPGLAGAPQQQEPPEPPQPQEPQEPQQQEPPDEGRAPEEGQEGAPAEQEAALPRPAQDVRLLRIQKTGGSIFGDVVMKKFCDQPTDACLGAGHDDWSQVTENGTYHGSVVTLLRDPVERIMSEFFWLRGGDAESSRADWDFRNKTWLGIVQNATDVERAWDVYLHGDEKSPSRNRQTMYLLGFRGGRTGERAYDGESPGAAYKWDHEPGKYVRWAMERLEAMKVYGITDCWTPSMRAVARQLGWDARAVEDFTAASTPEYGKHAIDMSAPAKSVGSSWRRNLSRQKIFEIERLNKVDLMVFRKALSRFTERFGEACNLPYEPFGPVMRAPLEKKPASV